MKTHITILFVFPLAIALSNCNHAKPAHTQTASAAIRDTVPGISTPTPLPLVETHWKLIQLNGKEVNVTAERSREPHLRLTPADNRITGNAGCNAFNGKYLLEEENHIRFMEVGSTRMACEHMEIETQFFNVLGTADSFSLQHDTLSLYAGKGVPLARFVGQ
jgi:heat shock protein HslJ